MVRHSPMALATRLVDDESGATSLEYALIGTIVSIFIIGSLVTFQNALTTVFVSVKDNITAAMGS